MKLQNHHYLILIIFILTFFIKCSNKNQSEDEEIHLCCSGENTFEELNVDNINIQSTDFLVPGVFTPNEVV